MKACPMVRSKNDTGRRLASSRPLPSRCARHPPPERGWARTMEDRNVAISLAANGWRGPPKAPL